MSAEVLRRAAALMRERAEAATPGPWVQGQTYHAEPTIKRAETAPPDHNRCTFGIVATPSYGAVDNGRANAHHIASWHPAVALAVADWLDEVAAHHDSWAISRGLQPVAHPRPRRRPRLPRGARMKSLLQFTRDLATSSGLFVTRPRCPYYACEGKRFPFAEFEAHVHSHAHDDRPRVRRWEDVRDPAAKWARETAGEES